MDKYVSLRHLTIFIKVCEEKSMTGAAAVLHMTQPSVSQAIHEIESVYGTALFERLNRRLYITPAGTTLLSYACRIVSLMHQAGQAMASYSLPPIRIGASVTIGEVFLVELLQHMNKIDAAQELFSEIHNTSELEHMLLNSALDVALVEGSITSPYLLSSPFMVDELVLIVHPAHRLAAKGRASVTELTGIPFFLREEGSGTRNLFLHAMESYNIPVCIAGSYNNTESLKKAVAAGIGATVLSRRLVEDDIRRGLTAPVEIENVSLKRIFKIVHHKDKYLSPPLHRLMSACIHYKTWFFSESSK